MKLRLPAYYKSFKCIADRCTDNCCIGWEIDIDQKTADYYNSVDGEFGKRLEENIKDGSFVLCGERCPFLNNRNLCDIITTLGEEHLCCICAEHPRFYGWYGDIKEGGIGLCCEEAARIILTSCDSDYYETDIPDEDTEEVDEELFGFLVNAREEIFRYLDDDSISFHHKVCDLLDYGEALQFESIDCRKFSTASVENGAESEKEADISAFISAFDEFEPIDETWTTKLSTLSGKKPTVCDKYLTNIFKYFVWRYFLRASFDGDVLTKLQFAAISCAMISIMADSDSLSDYVDAAKLYSKEIEYSEENVEMLCDMCLYDPVFSVENLKALVI